MRKRWKGMDEKERGRRSGSEWWKGDEG